MRFTIYKLQDKIHETIIIFDIRQFFGGRVAAYFINIFQ